MIDTSFLVELKELLHDRGGDVIFPCIRDLVENGVRTSRFSVGERAPNRQDITQYLAAWCRHAGLTEDECRDWLIDYCVEMLSSISRSTASKIRHSTKSNIKYIYKDGISFTCGLENNPFKADCGTECPVYAEMETALAITKSQEGTGVRFVRRESVPVEPAPAVKEIHREQFQKALSLVRQELATSTKNEILMLLKHQGFKTRTGRDWTFATLGVEIRKIETTSE